MKFEQNCLGSQGIAGIHIKAATMQSDLVGCGSGGWQVAVAVWCERRVTTGISFL